MKQNSYILILTVLTFFLISQKGYACFCMEENIETANYQKYHKLFLGKIINIKRIEVQRKMGDEIYTLCGTETTFEILKKWKGDNNKTIKIYQEKNSCSIDFSITNSRWIISGFYKPFVNSEFRKKYPETYLQTDNCSLYLEELDYEEFEKDIKKIDIIFPQPILLKKASKIWLWGILGFLAIFIICFKIKYEY